MTKKIEIPKIGKTGLPILPEIKTVPDIKTVTEWVEIAKAEAEKLRVDLENAIDKLSF